MGSADLSATPLAELLAMRNAIDREIVRRGHARTAGSLSGELMERVVADAYAGVLTPPTNKSVDVVGGDGRAIQVKVRSLPRGVSRFWPFGDLDFDLAVVIAMDRQTSEIAWARELTSDEVRGLVVRHSSGTNRLRMTAARASGLDVTERLRAAFSQLI